MIRGHGGEVYHLARELGLSPKDIQDHSSNVSPLPPPEGLYELLKRHLKEIEWLPEADSHTLREALASVFPLPPASFFPSSGTTEWIFAIPRLGSWKKALILGPTYGDYADALKLAGIPFSYLLSREEDSFRPDLFLLRKELRDKDLVFLCNPNNPTGVYLPFEELEKLIREHPPITFVVDESYLDFHPQGKSLLFCQPFPENLIVLRSFSKIYRIPGLRLGFCAAGKAWQKRLEKAFLPWAVNRLAQVAGPWLLGQREYLAQVVDFVQRERKRLLPELKKLPRLKLFAGEIHFFLLKGEEPVKEIWEVLWRKFHLLTREASNFWGLGPKFLRIALRSQPENDRLLKALREVWS